MGVAGGDSGGVRGGELGGGGTSSSMLMLCCIAGCFAKLKLVNVVGSAPPGCLSYDFTQKKM